MKPSTRPGVPFFPPLGFKILMVLTINELMVYRNFTFVEGESGTQFSLKAHAGLKSIIAPSPLGREEFVDVGQWVCDPVFMSDPRWIFLLVLIAIHLAF